jgi:hypothetical protein
MHRDHRLVGLVSYAAASAGLLALSGAAHAQWTATSLHPAGLHPPGAWQSYATGGSGTTQVGYTLNGGVRRACRWNGSAASWVDINPAGSVSSAALASSGTQVGGWAWGTSAALWNGGSVVNLDGATVYGMSIALIAAVYIGFAVADGRPAVIAVETIVAGAFVVLAAAGVTGSAWLIVIGFVGHGLKDLWQHRSHFVANTRWWPPFCMTIDFVAAAIIAVAIVSGVTFHQ